MNRQERQEDLKETLFESDLDLTPAEVLSYLYHWYKHERAIQARNRAQRKIRKHGSQLNADRLSYQVRKYLKDF